VHTDSWMVTRIDSDCVYSTLYISIYIIIAETETEPGSVSSTGRSTIVLSDSHVLQFIVFSEIVTYGKG